MPATTGMPYLTRAKARIGDWTEHGTRHRLVVTAELRVAQPAGRDHETIDHATIHDPLNLSFTGNIREQTPKGGWAEGSSGAGVPGWAGHVTEFAAPGEPGAGLGWDQARANRLVDLASSWHLNTMQAGCAHQTVVWEDGWYGRRPSLELTEPCPHTGYRYGSKWLVKPVTLDVAMELRDLFGDNFVPDEVLR